MTIIPKNNRRNFDDLQQTELGNYVYALRDPRDNKIFYIGQASENNRLFAHFREAEDFLNNRRKVPTPKILRIIEIWAAEEDVEWIILAHNLSNKEKNIVESSAIDLLTNSQNGPALNMVKGRHSSLLNEIDIRELGAEPVNPQKPYDTVFVFPVFNQLSNGLAPYEATRRAWYVVEKFRNKKNAIAVGISNFISKGVFRIDNWHAIDNKHEFDKAGNNEIVDELLNKNWASIINTSMGYWQRGNYLIISFDGKGHFKFLRGNPDKNTEFNL